jgi:DNA-binding transcriptional MerR regulator
MPNGYRIYSENDLLRLQQILALKFFGFELEQIKSLLSGNVNMHDHFAIQAKFLREKAKALMTASETLQNLIASCSLDKSIPWETIIQLIEVFNMTNELEKSWAADVFTPEELKQYARLEMEKKTKYPPEAKQRFSEKWNGLVNQTRANLSKDPTSPIGAQIAKDMMDLVGGLYGKDNANLRHTIWEKGFKKGKMEGDLALEPEVVAWLDKAMDNFYRSRIYNILAQVEVQATPELAQRWDDLMTEMYGNAQQLKQACYEAGKDDPKVGPKAKKWLLQFYNKQ